MTLTHTHAGHAPSRNAARPYPPSPRCLHLPMASTSQSRSTRGPSQATAVRGPTCARRPSEALGPAPTPESRLCGSGCMRAYSNSYETALPLIACTSSCDHPSCQQSVRSCTCTCMRMHAVPRGTCPGRSSRPHRASPPSALLAQTGLWGAGRRRRLRPPCLTQRSTWVRPTFNVVHNRCYP